MAFCSKCGSASDDGTRFCGSCGAVLAVVSATTAAGSATTSLSALSLGQKICGGGSALGLLLFFLPWVDVFGSAKMSGVRLAFQDKPKSLLLLALPATSLAVLWYLYQAITTRSNNKQASLVGIAGGILSLLAMLWLHSSVRKGMGGMGSKLFTEWFWISVAATIAVVIGAVKDRASS